MFALLKKRNGLAGLGGFVLPVFCLLAVLILMTSCSSGDSSSGGGREGVAIKETDIVIGNREAKTTIVEYVDLQCPACAQFNQIIFKRVWRLIKQDVRWVFRNYPLKNIHPYAEIASQYNEAAGIQGKYLEFHDLLFQNQSAWSSLGGKEEVEEKFLDYGEALGLDKEKLQQDAFSPSVMAKINADIASGNQLGVTGTPSVFIDGEKISLPRNAEEFFKQIVEKVKEKS